MNKKAIIRNAWRSLCVLALAGLASCIADDYVQGPADTQARESGLYFALQADGGMQPVVTRTPGVDALNENLVQTVDVFVFKADGSLNTNGHVQGTPDASGVVAVYQGSDWKNNFAADETYTVYALANYKGTADLTQVTSLDDLKEVRATDEKIAYWKGMAGYAEEKTFLMDGKAAVSATAFPADNTPYVLEIPMERAAVKVEVTVNFSEEWAGKFIANDLEAQVTHHATVTPAIAEGYAIDNPDDRGYATTPNRGGDVKDDFSDAFVCAKGTNNAVAGSKIRFYAYVNRWDDMVTNETMLLIDLPGTLTEENEAPRVLDHNFYKIPIISNTENQVMQRNTFYQITATVDMEGTSDIDEPVELTDVQFKTAEWVTSTVPVGEGDSPKYLILSEYHKDIRNADGFNEGDGLEFYSSSTLSGVRVATSQEIATAVQNGDITFNYPGEGNSVPGIFFVNKDNERVSVDANDPNGDDPRYGDYNKDDKVSVEYDQYVVEGGIRLTSTNPVNVTKRYITLKVTNMDELSKYVVIEQYPLEYIQPIAGYYSYRDDLKAAGGTYEEHGTTSGINSNVYRSNGTYVFVPKVETSSGIRGWYWESSWWEWSVTTASAYNYNYASFPSNNMMYFVTITQTDPKYNIAHPLTESGYNGQSIAVSSEENDELVSPSFMLASQLGTVMASGMDGWTDARKHCAYYVETYQLNGQTYVLDDWRLPTTAEIKVIVEYQDETPDVMAEVLSGAYYYVAWQNAKESLWNAPSGAAATGKDGSDVAVRCIRDVKPTDAFLQSTNQ